MTQALKGQVALVTGAAHRVGKHIALALAAEGASLVVHYHRSADAASSTLQEIRETGGDAIKIQADQSDPVQVARMFDHIQSHYGRLDILVNSASMFQRQDFLQLPHPDWQRTLDVNLTGPFLCSQHAARLMLGNTPPGGLIINILDNIGRLPWPDYPHHSVAKAGLLMLTRVMARYLAPDIRVNGIVPGPVLKPAMLSDERWTAIGTENPMQRPGSPEDVARAVTYLSRENFLTGAILSVDGGEWLTNYGGDMPPN